MTAFLPLSLRERAGVRGNGEPALISGIQRGLVSPLTLTLSQGERGPEFARAMGWNQVVRADLKPAHP